MKPALAGMRRAREGAEDVVHGGEGDGEVGVDAPSHLRRRAGEIDPRPPAGDAHGGSDAHARSTEPVVVHVIDSTVRPRGQRARAPRA